MNMGTFELFADGENKGTITEEANETLSSKMTIADALRYEALGYELTIEDGEVTRISKRKAPHVVEEHEAAV